MNDETISKQGDPEVSPGSTNPTDYAHRIANESYAWYKSRAIFCRRAFWISESLLLATTSAIPVLIVAFPTKTIWPAAFGAVAATLAGLRPIFNWRENYIRYSKAREEVEAHRRAYSMNMDPYASCSNPAGLLVAKVTEIEQSELRAWLAIADRASINQSDSREPDSTNM